MPDVKTGIYQCELAIDYYRDARYQLGHKYWDELRDKFRELKYPPPKQEAPTGEDNDSVPFWANAVIHHIHRRKLPAAQIHLD